MIDYKLSFTYEKALPIRSKPIVTTHYRKALEGYATREFKSTSVPSFGRVIDRTI